MFLFFSLWCLHPSFLLRLTCLLTGLQEKRGGPQRVSEGKVAGSQHSHVPRDKEKIDGEIDSSLPDTLRPLLCLSFSNELSNGLVLCQLECLLQEIKKKAIQMNWTQVYVSDLILKLADELCLISGLQEMSSTKGNTSKFGLFKTCTISWIYFWNYNW